MTTYELAVLSSFGETHKIIIDSKYLEKDTAKDAISMAYYGIAGCHWFEITNNRNERPAVRVRWERIGKDGRRIQYSKLYTCQRLRDYHDLALTTRFTMTIEDLDNILLGKDFALFIIQDNPNPIPTLYKDSAALKHRFKDLWNLEIGHTWIHKWDDAENRQEFMAQFKEAHP